MYTTLRLIRMGWQFTGEENLGMAPVTDRLSAWYGTVSVPRMVQNQLDHLLELKMIELDGKILKAVQQLLYKRSRPTWIIGTLAVFILLHVRELDAGRNIYWRRYKDSVGTRCLFQVADKLLIGSRANSGYTRRNPQLLLKKRLPHVILCCGITTVQ